MYKSKEKLNEICRQMFLNWKMFRKQIAKDTNMCYLEIRVVW